MAEKIKLVHGDTKPALVVSLTDATSGGALGLNGATVKLYFRAVGQTTILATVTAQLLPGIVLSDGTINSASPYNTLGSGGRCQFNWGATDLNQDAGDYEGEIEITYPDGTIQTVYDLLKFKLRKDF
jgi:hypothetical protein